MMICSRALCCSHNAFTCHPKALASELAVVLGVYSLLGDVH